MEAIVERCCGIDIGQASVTACLLVGASHCKPTKAVKTFGTMRSDLLGLKQWLQTERCTVVVMESTGVYWEPVYNVLEGAFDLVVGNAQHIKNVPGRKTDVKDSEWLADLGRHGLVRRSFVPPQPFRALRVLTRYRRKVVEGGSAERNRVLKLLERANLKLATVASDVFGKSGMLMLRAMGDGEKHAGKLSELAQGRLRNKLTELRLALDGRVTEHHRFVLRCQLQRLDRFDADIKALDEQIEQQLRPYDRTREVLMTIPGVDKVLAAAVLAEIGVDMSSFPTAAHLAAWAGICPGNYESAGKKRAVRARIGNVALKTALVQAAQSAARTRGSYLRSKFYRIAARRGHKRAAVAIAHKIIVSAYRMLSTDCEYQDLGEAYLDRITPKRVTRDLVARLERMGYQVLITQKAA